MERDEIKEYTINEEYYIPSRGKIYSQNVNPLVRLKSMNGFDELKRKGSSVAPLKVLADLVEGCMVEKPAIHVYDMSLGDYQFLLQKLRIVSYGSKYNMTVQCPYCQRYIEIETDLDDFEAQELDMDEFELRSNLVLPDSGAKIALNFQTPHLLDAIDDKAKELKKKFKTAKIDFESLAKFLLTIHSVDGEKLSQYDLEEFIKNMSAKDMRYIEIGIDKLNEVVGGNVSVPCECPECGGEPNVSFRFGPEFFRPTNL